MVDHLTHNGLASPMSEPGDLAPGPFPEGMISRDRATIYRDRFTSVTDVVETVRRWGIIVFPNFIRPETLGQLNDEFEAMIPMRRKIAVGIDEFDHMINLRLDRTRLNEQPFPATAAFFGQPLMQEIAAAYYPGEEFWLNYQLFVTLLSETKNPQMKPPFALHFDKRQCLKFFIYLTNTDETNGAMRATPGSIMRNRVTRGAATETVSNLEDIENVVPEPLEPSIPITGPAGTLFIFDTDMNHGASFVQPGHTRRTMRGHTQPLHLLRRMGYRV